MLQQAMISHGALAHTVHSHMHDAHACQTTQHHPDPAADLAGPLPGCSCPTATHPPTPQVMIPRHAIVALLLLLALAALPWPAVAHAEGATAVPQPPGPALGYLFRPPSGVEDIYPLPATASPPTVRSSRLCRPAQSPEDAPASRSAVCASPSAAACLCVSAAAAPRGIAVWGEQASGLQTVAAAVSYK